VRRFTRRCINQLIQPPRFIPPTIWEYGWDVLSLLTDQPFASLAWQCVCQWIDDYYRAANYLDNRCDDQGQQQRPLILQRIRINEDTK